MFRHEYLHIKGSQSRCSMYFAHICTFLCGHKSANKNAQYVLLITCIQWELSNLGATESIAESAVYEELEEIVGEGELLKALLYVW